MRQLAINNTSVVNSQAAQLALVAQTGDVAIRTDTSTSYLQNGGTSGTMSDWTQILNPMGVTTVNTQTGNVVLTTSNISEGSNQYFTSARVAQNAITGDVTGTIAASTVAKIQGKAVSAATPTTGYVLKWDGSQWAPAIDIGTNGADASSLRGTSVASTSPTSGQYLKYDGTNWTPATIPAIPTTLSSFTNDSLFITSAALPTKLSQLSNDPGFITAAAVPTKVSQLSNDSGFLTAATIPGVPTNLSQLVNDTNFISSVTKLQATAISPAAPISGQFSEVRRNELEPGDDRGRPRRRRRSERHGEQCSGCKAARPHGIRSGSGGWSASGLEQRDQPVDRGYGHRPHHDQLTTPSSCRKIPIP